MHDFYLNKFLQKLFFGNGGIFLIVLVFLLNLGIVICIDGFLLFPIPATSNYREGPDFSDHIQGDILDKSLFDDTGFLLYRDENGNRHLATVKRNDVTRRYRIIHSKDQLIPENEDPFVYKAGNFFHQNTITVSGDKIELQEGWGNNTIKGINTYMLIALGALAVEMYILRTVTGKE